MEIGSVYEINPTAVSVADHEPVKELQLDGVLKYGKQNIAYTASGRDAIALALYSLEQEMPDVSKKCLMPVYMCDTVFIPFLQRGWELIFYHIGKDMRADGEEIRTFIEEERPGMLFIHGYYGVDTWDELRADLANYQEKGLLVMEDMTQSYYMCPNSEDRKKGIFQSDYIVGSLRKWYAVPDGGFIATNRTLYREDMAYNDDFVKRRLQMLTQKWEYLNEMQNRKGYDSREKQRWVETVLPRLVKMKEEYLAENRRLEEELDHFTGVRRISSISANLLLMVDEKECEERRKENLRILYEGLSGRKTIIPVFGEYTEEAAPLYMPVYMQDRDALQKFLREHDIYVPVLWLVGKENAECLSEDEEYIFSHVAAIPMDQRYEEKEMKRIIDVIEEYEKLL